MDILTVISTCSLHRDLGLIIAMAMSFSHGNPFAVEDAVHSLGTDDTELVANESDDLSTHHAPKTLADAVAAYERIAANGGVPVLGLVPVSPAWAGMFDKKVAEVFDPCVDVSIATAMLDEFSSQCGKRGRACVVRKYAEALQYEPFAVDVLAQIRANALPARAEVVVETDAILQAPIFAGTDAARDWGADQIFFPGTKESPSRAQAPAEPGATAKRR